MNSLKSMKDALRPLGLYNLGEDSFISRELSCYAQFLDEVGEAMDSLLTEGFLQTAGEEGIARMEALAGARQPEETALEKRREMLLYRFAHRPDDFNREGMLRGLAALGLTAQITENFGAEQLILSDDTAFSDPAQYLRIRREALDLLPAHLEVLFNLGTLTWTVFQGKDFTWNQWNSQNLNWMEFEIFS